MREKYSPGSVGESFEDKVFMRLPPPPTSQAGRESFYRARMAAILRDIERRLFRREAGGSIDSEKV